MRIASSGSPQARQPQRQHASGRAPLFPKGALMERKRAGRMLFGGLLLAASGGAALGQNASCRVDPFQGAAAPQGAVTRMQIVNAGGSCFVAAYGAAAGRLILAQRGGITKQPAHGKAEFVAPRARYTPKPGYVGRDEFEVTAFALGPKGEQRLKVRVMVSVVAP